jgi:hypothetical protein
MSQNVVNILYVWYKFVGCVTVHKYLISFYSYYGSCPISISSLLSKIVIYIIFHKKYIYDIKQMQRLAMYCVFTHTWFTVLYVTARSVNAT